MRGVLEPYNITDIKCQLAKSKLLDDKSKAYTSEMQADTSVLINKQGYYSYTIPCLLYDSLGNYKDVEDRMLTCSTSFDGLIRNVSHINDVFVNGSNDDWTIKTKALKIGDLVVKTAIHKRSQNIILYGVVNSSVVFMFQINSDGKTFKLESLEVIDDTVLKIDFTLKKRRHQLFLNLENYEFNYKYV